MAASSSFQILDSALRSSMPEIGAVRIDTHLWAIDNSWNLVVVNTNITRRAGRGLYSLIVAIHWLWDVKEHVSLDFGRFETSPIPDDGPALNTQFQLIVSEAAVHSQALSDQVQDVASAYRAVMAQRVANPRDPRKLFHKYVLCRLCDAPESGAIYTDLVAACYGPQTWKKNLLEIARDMNQTQHRSDIVNMVSQTIARARELKGLPRRASPIA